MLNKDGGSGPEEFVEGDIAFVKRRLNSLELAAVRRSNLFTPKSVLAFLGLML